MPIEGSPQVSSQEKNPVIQTSEVQVQADNAEKGRKLANVLAKFKGHASRALQFLAGNNSADQVKNEIISQSDSSKTDVIPHAEQQGTNLGAAMGRGIVEAAGPRHLKAEDLAKLHRPDTAQTQGRDIIMTPVGIAVNTSPDGLSAGSRDLVNRYIARVDSGEDMQEVVKGLPPQAAEIVINAYNQRQTKNMEINPKASITMPTDKAGETDAAFNAMATGIREGAQAKVAEYVARAKNGENVEHMLQGIDKTSADAVREAIARSNQGVQTRAPIEEQEERGVTKREALAKPRIENGKLVIPTSEQQATDLIHQKKAVRESAAARGELIPEGVDPLTYIP